MTDLVKNFLRRWSTIDITRENELFFAEHKSGVLALVNDNEAHVIADLTAATPRAVFAKRYHALTVESF